GRDLWVPAHATMSTWMLVGPAAAQPSEVRRDVQFLLYDRSGGKDERVEDTQERLRSRRVLYRQREPFTAILLDEEGVENVVFGELPKPPSQADEALLLARTFRSACNLSEHVSIVQPGALPPLAEAFDGVDHFVLASERIAQDPSGMQALRQWLERGGSLWVLLDMVAPDAIAPLLGGALDFAVVDRVSLTAFAIESQTNSAERLEQRHERPVEFVRVLLPKEEREEHTVNGWPAWFTRQVGRGKVVFTTVGPQAWFRAREGKDRPSPYTTYPGLPLPMTPLQQLADELHPGSAPSSVAVDELRPLLADEIGYVVVGRGSLALVLATFLLVALALGIALRRSRRPELLGWLGPAAAVGAAAVLFVLGESGRRSAAPTVAVAQLVDAVSGTEEATVRGLLAAYRPDSGTAKIGAANGGSFDLDMAGLEGQSRRLVFS